MGRAQPQAPAAVQLVAVEPIDHNGVRIAPGELFQVDAAVAQALQASGAATAAVEPSEQPPLV